MQTFKCRCGCGGAPEYGEYLPGHDAKHRSQLIDKAGGVDGLSKLLDLVDYYMDGEIGEREFAKGIRKLRAGK